VRLHAHLEARSKDGLPCWRGDRTALMDIGTDEHDASPVAVGTSRAGNCRTGLDGHVAVDTPGRWTRNNESWGAVGAARDIESRKEELGVPIIEQALANEVVVDGEGGGDEGAGIDLAATAENDAVLVEDVNLALGIDSPEDLGGGYAADDLVEGDPFADVGTAGGLVEVEGGIASDIEGLPVEEGLLLGLGNVDVVAALSRGASTDPAGVRACRDFEAAGGEAIWHKAGACGSPGGGLHRAHGIDGLRGAGEAVLGTDLRGGGGFCSGVGAGFCVPAGGGSRGRSTSENVSGLDADGKAREEQPHEQCGDEGLTGGMTGDRYEQAPAHGGCRAILSRYYQLGWALLKHAEAGL